MTAQFPILFKGGHVIDPAIFYVRGISPPEITLIEDVT